MIEVESKVLVRDVRKIRRAISNLGKYLGKEKKVDDYYTLEDLSRYPKKSLRVRRRKGFHEINFKQRISFASGVHSKKEVEFQTTDIKGFLDLIEDFGFKKWLRKEKISYVYNVRKNFNIELNKVRSLGWFLEIEYLVSDKKDIPKARKEINKIMSELGVSEKDVVKDGYTKMLWRSKN